MRFTASLETFQDTSCLGWVHELPGCAAHAPHRTQIERALAAEIRRFLAEAGEPVPDRIELAVAGEAEVPGNGAEATSVLIASDRAPLDPELWDRCANRLAASRARLLAPLADTDLADDAWPALRDELRHVALLELIMTARTFDTDTPEGLRGFLDWTRDVALARMSEAAATDSGAVSGSGEPDAEQWTAAKVARRLVWHERLHLRPGSHP